ncbi:hypothetical protein EUZ85_26995 [Hahella sp. KA22]|uniref:hypothetical protein n=1 Tax=Hahella sp. KA22 TaxID=1628392 RepID=UPI000FDD5F68|nr:hypothetical protein [Hahella sp. KA22]AZZ94168.1 hypothetical protein ENC22_24410 [Hahella sp. KA22]QAY57542.1 hypothetical protein EUZ85_26995 [Hahella sp. KA22]
MSLIRGALQRQCDFLIPFGVLHFSHWSLRTMAQERPLADVTGRMSHLDASWDWSYGCATPGPGAMFKVRTQIVKPLIVAMIMLIFATHRAWGQGATELSLRYGETLRYEGMEFEVAYIIDTLRADKRVSEYLIGLHIANDRGRELIELSSEEPTYWREYVLRYSYADREHVRVNIMSELSR